MDILWNDPESTLTKWKTPLFEDEKIVELPVDQRTVTRSYTRRRRSTSSRRIGTSRSSSTCRTPCLIFRCMCRTMCAIPNPKNAYINTIEHIDFEVGRLLDVLDELKPRRRTTYVIYARRTTAPGCRSSTMGAPPDCSATARGRPSRAASACPA